ncbi:MAG TPA: NAD(P)H-hydrate epimerase, partial [Gemmatimonadaceae bacterium]|nr:NAD(P)H-hydrate epimerase [Gemmatimonadaceae bacterium]
MTVRVVTADEGAARDASAIAAGIPSFQLMRRAGEGAARVLLERLPVARGRRALVCCGPGNNGGDGWIVAAALARGGMAVHVDQALEPRTPDAAAAREAALGAVSLGIPPEPVDLVVDALLGTGAQGTLRGAVAESAARIAAARAGGATIVALDLPTGLDATTGELARGAVHADLTITFGTVKRGQLLARGACGEVVAIDIGLGVHAGLADGAPPLVDARWVAQRTPAIAADAHKGTRRRLLIVGGDRGMAGAVALAARGALRSGIGMVKLCVHPDSLAPLQAVVPEATAVDWPTLGPDAPLVEWPHVVLIGPGLGGGIAARARVTSWFEAWRGPVVLDADALNA